MRAVIGLVVLLMATLPGCGVKGPAPAAPASSTKTVATADPLIPKCKTEQLAARLGPRTDVGGGQNTMPLIYTNTSDQPCSIRGAPQVDLHGPADPNGPVYSLFHEVDTGRGLVLQPGSSAAARLVVQSDNGKLAGSKGSNNWIPTQLVTVPPANKASLTVPWPSDLPVLRQDGVDRPGSFVGGIKADSSNR